MVGSECITCGIYTVAADKLQPITGNFLKGARRHENTNMLPPLLDWAVQSFCSRCVLILHLNPALPPSHTHTQHTFAQV